MRAVKFVRHIVLAFESAGRHGVRLPVWHLYQRPFGQFQPHGHRDVARKRAARRVCLAMYAVYLIGFAVATLSGCHPMRIFITGAGGALALCDIVITVKNTCGANPLGGTRTVLWSPPNEKMPGFLWRAVRHVNEVAYYLPASGDLTPNHRNIAAFFNRWINGV